MKKILIIFSLVFFTFTLCTEDIQVDGKEFFNIEGEDVENNYYYYTIIYKNGVYY